MKLRRLKFAAISPAIVASLLVAVTSGIGLDYYADAAPGIQALASHDIGRWAAEQPQMGQLSILVRAPVAMLGLSELWTYRLGAFVLLFAPVALFGYLLQSRPLTRASSAAVLAVICLNPMTIRALALGHPEEPLGGALCALALLLALDRRARWAGLALGLALGTKQWALFAVLPVLFACGSNTQRRRVLEVALPVAALLTLPPVLVDPHAFWASMNRPIAGLGIMRPGNLWALVVPQDGFVDSGGQIVPLSVVPPWLRSLAHPLVIGIALVLAMGWRHRSGARPESALALLALVFLSRCILDPWNHGYYHWPFLAALACWELRGLGRAPVLTALSSACLWIAFVALKDAAYMDFGYMAWAVFMVVWLVREAFGPWQPGRARHLVAART